MIEEQGRVVAIEEGAVWIETLRKSTCAGCSANAGCGQGLMDRLGVGVRRGRIRALCDLHLQVGDTVVIGVREDLLLRSSVLVYLSPLLGLFFCALLAQGAGLGEPFVILAGLLGFVLAFCTVRWLSWHMNNNPASQPIVLHALLSGPAAAR